MREYTLAYDAKSKKFAFVYKCKLLKKYYDDFSNLMEKLKDDFSVEKLGNNVIQVLLPFEVEPEELKTRTIAPPVMDEGSSMGGMKVGMKLEPEDAEELYKHLEKVQTLIFDFEDYAMKEETKNLEFLPLSGYPTNNIIEDAKSAFENKRDFCVIDTMESYNNFSTTATLNQAIYKFGTDSYNNILLAAMIGDMEELKRITKDSLKKNEWL
jgi:hypothetical protein